MTQLWVSVDELDDPSAPQALEAAQAASMILYMLSGQKYRGLTDTTELYICQDHGDYSISVQHSPTVVTLGSWHWVNGRWTSPQNELRLRGQPVRSITSISIDGTVIDSLGYQLVNSGLVRSVSGTWSSYICGSGVEVSYTYGVAPPALGHAAARLLANELLKSLVDPSSCGLPDRVTSITREGISMAILDPQDFLDKGRTGLYLVDLFLKSVNPYGARKRARVFSPDTPRAFRNNN